MKWPTRTSDILLPLIGVAAITVALLPSGGPRLSPKAERVFYHGGASRAWGSVCALPGGGYVSVNHVTGNGVPKLGPRDRVTAKAEASDWSFLGVDPATLRAEDFPEIAKGMKVEIHGFPARDRDGEVIPGVVYTSDPVPPFWWVELHDEASDSFGGSVPAEAVIGGISGSCVLDANDRIVAVVHANGFSEIEGTTNTWAMVIPVQSAIREARKEADFTSLARLPPDVPVPEIERGRWRLTEPGD